LERFGGDNVGDFWRPSRTRRAASSTSPSSLLAAVREALPDLKSAGDGTF